MPAGPSGFDLARDSPAARQPADLAVVVTSVSEIKFNRAPIWETCNAGRNQVETRSASNLTRLVPSCGPRCGSHGRCRGRGISPAGTAGRHRYGPTVRRVPPPSEYRGNGDTVAGGGQRLHGHRHALALEREKDCGGSRKFVDENADAAHSNDMRQTAIFAGLSEAEQWLFATTDTPAQ